MNKTEEVDEMHKAVAEKRQGHRTLGIGRYPEII